jgi:hypothetical protein
MPPVQRMHRDLRMKRSAKGVDTRVRIHSAVIVLSLSASTLMGSAKHCDAGNSCPCSEDADCPSPLVCNSNNPGCAGLVHDEGTTLTPGYCRAADILGNRTPSLRKYAGIPGVKKLIDEYHRTCRFVKGPERDVCARSHLITIHTTICRHQAHHLTGRPSSWTAEMRQAFLSCLSQFGPAYKLEASQKSRIPDEWGSPEPVRRL